MYNIFLNNNLVCRELTNPMAISDNNWNQDFVSLIIECGGINIDNGLYRVHVYTSVIRWADTLNKHYPNFGGAILPFGFDWLGRQYCITRGKDNVILMLDPSTIESYSIASNLTDFHNNDLVNEKDDTV